MAYDNSKQCWKIGPYTTSRAYFNNGSGRDSYIAFNNGGLTNQARLNNNHPISGRYMNIGNNQPRIVKPMNNMKNVFYNCNGTGRDNYVVQNRDTQMGSWDLRNCPQELFLRSLRSQSTTFDQIQKGSNFNPLMARQQKFLIARLNQTKRKEEPFEKLVKSFRESSNDRLRSNSTNFQNLIQKNSIKSIANPNDKNQSLRSISINRQIRNHINDIDDLNLKNSIKSTQRSITIQK